MTKSVLTRSVSLPSAIFVVIGYVVGASIYILPGSLAPDTGPAIFIAYALAAIPAIVAGFVMAQIGAAFPVSGSIFVLLRGALSPYAGFAYQWIMLSMAAVVVPLVGFGFADYLGYFIPGLNARAVAATLALSFTVINLLGMTIATIAQSVMVIIFLTALAIFGVGGAFAGDIANLKPLFPKGYAVLSIAAITAYFSYAGVFVIAEIAGEIKDPARNIPRAVLLAFVLIIALYVLVPLALAMVIPWSMIGDTPIAVVTASQFFLPAPLVTFIAISALLASATTVNSILMGLSRDFFQGANSGLFPAVFALVNQRTAVPGRAILLVGGLSLAGIAVGGTITSYAQLALIGLMIIQVMTGIALLRLPTRMPEAYLASNFRLSIPVLRLVAISYIVFSLLFLYLLVSERSMLLLIGLVFLLAGVVYERAWSRARDRHGGTRGVTE